MSEGRVLIPCQAHYPELYERWRGGHWEADHDPRACSVCMEATKPPSARSTKRRAGGSRRSAYDGGDPGPTPPGADETEEIPF